MPQLLESILRQIDANALIDIGIVAVVIYGLFSLIRGTRAVSLVIGVTVLLAVYALAAVFDLQLLTQIMQTGAVVGLFALVVVFQPELRRVLERIGRVGSFGWLFSPGEQRSSEHVAGDLARAAAALSAEGHGALIVIERDTGLEEIAESGVMLHADLSVDLLRTIFMPRSALHDGAVVIRGEKVLAAGALLPLAETTIHTERFGTRHRAALGITEQTDAVVVVVSEENAQVSLVERARIVRNLNEPQLARAIRTLLTTQTGRSVLTRRAEEMRTAGGRAPRLADLARFVGRDRRRRPAPRPPATVVERGSSPAATAERPPGEPAIGDAADGAPRNGRPTAATGPLERTAEAPTARVPR